MTTKTKFAVGDKVRVYCDYGLTPHRQEGVEGTVMRVGRTLVDVKHGAEVTSFRQDTGARQSGWGGVYIRTLEEHDRIQRSSQALAVLRKMDIHPRGSTPLELLEQLAAVITTYWAQHPESQPKD